MSERDHEYDVFLSHASEDTAWCEKLSERLRDAGVRVWFDKWELRPGHHVSNQINKAIQRSRKMVAVWSRNYFHPDKEGWTLAESFSKQHPDVLADDRPVIPLLLEDCEILPSGLY